MMFSGLEMQWEAMSVCKVINDALLFSELLQLDDFVFHHDVFILTKVSVRKTFSGYQHTLMLPSQPSLSCC